jgi:predicted DNA-binding transcriptional regulator AlpA
MNDDDRYVSEIIVAKLTGMSRRTLQQWRRERRGPRWRRVGRRAVRYSLADVRRWLSEQQEQSSSANT